MAAALSALSAALSEEPDVSDEFALALAACLAASAMDARQRAPRTSPLQRFERRLRKSVDTFNRQFAPIHP